MSADEDSPVAFRRIGSQLERTDHIQIVHKNLTAEVWVEVFPRIFQICQLRERGPQKMRAGFDGHTRHELPPVLAEGRGPFDYVGEDRLSVQAQNHLHRWSRPPRPLL